MGSFIFVAVLVGFAAWYYMRQRYYRRAFQQMTAGDFDEALVSYNRAIRLHPRDAGAYHNRALVYGQQGDLEAALAQYTRALELNPRRTETYSARVYTYVHLGRMDDALQDSNIMIEMSPESAEGYLIRAYVYLRSGNNEAALDDCNHAIEMLNAELEKVEKFGAYISREDMRPELHRKLAGAYDLRAVIQHHMGDSASALDDYETAFRLTPDSPALHNDRGELYFALGQFEQALADFTRAQQLIAEVSQPWFMYNGKSLNDFIDAGQAVTYHALGQTDEALRLWRDLLERDPHFGDVEWVQQVFNWTASLADEAQKIVACLEGEYQTT